MPKQNAALLTRTFRGLADPTRLLVVERLAAGPASVSELADPFDMALPSFMQHLDVLDHSGLVSSRKEGRVRTYRLVPAHLRRATTWLDGQRSLWDRRLDQLDDHLINLARNSHDK
jgi:DNA-binding transcriptional ArsR family regulator